MKSNTKEHTSQVLLTATKNIIHTEGHEAITVRRVAESTGFSYPLLYHYFKDLNSLLWTLRIEMIEDMIAELKYSANDNISPIKEIKQVFKMYTAYFFDHPNVFRFFYFYTFKKPTDDTNNDTLDLRFKNMWQSTFERLVQNGYIEESNIEIIAKTIIFSIQGMIMLSLSANGSLGRNEVELELDMLLSYLLKEHIKSKEIL